MDVETSAFLKNTLSVDHQQMLGVSLGERKRSLTHSASSSGTSFRRTSGSEHGDLDDLQLAHQVSDPHAHPRLQPPNPEMQDCCTAVPYRVAYGLWLSHIV